MTLYTLLLYAVTSSTALSDSDRAAMLWRDQPSLEIVLAKPVAPECLEFCNVIDPK